MSRVERAEVTQRIRDFVNILRKDRNVLMFLRRAGHTIDGYNQAQVGHQPLVCY